MNWKRLAPLVVGNSVALASNATGVLSTRALSNQTRTPAVIDEIRFAIQGNANGIGSGGSISASIRLGSYWLTDRATPIWSFCPSMQANIRAERVTDFITPIVGYFRWPLPNPMFVEPGVSLDVTFVRDNDTLAGNMTAHFAAAGSYVDPKSGPNDLILPYVASWQSALGTAYSISEAIHLRNPFDVPLQVHRLTGRLYTRDAAELVAVSSDPDDPQVKMLDSDEREVIKDFTTFVGAFDSQRRAWTFDYMLPPKKWLVTTVRNIPASTSAHIAMIGSRVVGTR